jgi:predicted transport protein
MSKRKNKQDNIILLILGGVLLVCFIAICLLFYKYFYAGTSETKYGDRLDGIENYVLSSTLVDDIKAIYKDNKSIVEITTNNQGRIVYINMEFAPGTKAADAKTLAAKALEAIGEDNLTYYEIQFLLTCKETEGFPIFGSKSASGSKVVW